MVPLWAVREGQQCLQPIPKDFPRPRIMAEFDRWMESWSTSQKGQLSLAVNLLLPKTSGMSTRVPIPWEVDRFPSKEGYSNVYASRQLVLGEGKRQLLANLKLLEEWRRVAEEQPHWGVSFRRGMSPQQKDRYLLGEEGPSCCWMRKDRNQDYS